MSTLRHLSLFLLLAAAPALADDAPRNGTRDTGQPETVALAGNSALPPPPPFDPDAGVDLETLYASADPVAGEALWRLCRACHSLDPGRNGIGPSLMGVVGAQVAVQSGYDYSGALLSLGTNWDVAALSRYIARPAEAVPGTRMAFVGVRDRMDRLNLIRFLDEQAR